MDGEYGPVASVRTRADAVEDGTFIEILPRMASAAGIAMPLFVTAGARQEFVAGIPGKRMSASGCWAG
ncbi:hypothetical protein [Streptomyces decoyicus]